MKEMKANKRRFKTIFRRAFLKKSQMLDEQIDLKVKMKSILSVDQFEKWDAMKSKQKRRSQRMNTEKKKCRNKKQFYLVNF
jgi:hypothetical protein